MGRTNKSHTALPREDSLRILAGGHSGDGGGWWDGYAAPVWSSRSSRRATAGARWYATLPPFSQHLPRSVPNMTRLRSRPFGDTGFIPIASVRVLRDATRVSPFCYRQERIPRPSSRLSLLFIRSYTHSLAFPSVWLPRAEKVYT